MEITYDEVVNDCKYFNKLPVYCYADIDGYECPAIIQRCCYKIGWSNRREPDKFKRAKMIDEMNAEIGVTREQMKAMKFGVWYGWSGEGVNPEMYKFDVAKR